MNSRVFITQNVVVLGGNKWWGKKIIKRNKGEVQCKRNSILNAKNP